MHVDSDEEPRRWVVCPIPPPLSRTLSRTLSNRTVGRPFWHGSVRCRGPLDEVRDEVRDKVRDEGAKYGVVVGVLLGLGLYGVGVGYGGGVRFPAAWLWGMSGAMAACAFGARGGWGVLFALVPAIMGWVGAAIVVNGGGGESAVWLMLLVQGIWVVAVRESGGYPGISAGVLSAWAGTNGVWAGMIWLAG